LKKNLKIIRN